jgi:hypothetical protein
MTLSDLRTGLIKLLTVLVLSLILTGLNPQPIKVSR